MTCITFLPGFAKAEEDTPTSDALRKSNISVEEVRRLAKEGDTEAQTVMCHLYSEGGLVGRDFDKAFRWCYVASKRGNAAAQFSLGTHYFTGNGVEQSDEKALMWYLVAEMNGLDEYNDIKEGVAELMPKSAVRNARSKAAQCFQSSYKFCE